MEPQAPYYPPVTTEADLEPGRTWRRDRYKKILANLDNAIGPAAVVEAKVHFDRGMRHTAEEVNRWKKLEEEERTLRVQLEDRLLKVSLLAIALFAWAGIVTTLYVAKVWK